MMEIGVVEASKFVGKLAVKLFHAEEMIADSPTVHAVRSVERLTYKMDYRIANSFDQALLEAAFEGCDAVIHPLLGSDGFVRDSIIPTYKAAQKAGVCRIVDLSSMIVHMSALAVDTIESTPLTEKQPFPTHRAKVSAERKLLQLEQSGAVKVVISRLGTMFDPGSHWITELVNPLRHSQLRHRAAYFSNEDKGICNTVYVDNLIHAIRLALTQPEAYSERA